MSDELTKMSATRLAALIRTRALSPVEAVEAHLKRIDEVNPQLNALVTLAPEALDEARRAEARLMRGDDVGALCGVPLAVKDTIDTRGLRTTSGSRLRENFVPEADAPAVGRLREAGAILIGKTNTSEMALDYATENPVFGRTNNPHSTAHTPGGSSGGCAAAVAAGLVPASLGSDLSGSIRIPAHFCGVYGLKPTGARVPTAGHLPPTTGPFSLGASLGPLARSVEDLELLYRALRGQESSSMSESHAGGLRTGKPSSGDVRAAWYVDDGSGVHVTEETRRAVSDAARALEEAGYQVREERPPSVEHGGRLWFDLFSRPMQEFLLKMYAGREEEGGAGVRLLLERARGAPPLLAEEYFRAWEERDRLRCELVDWMNSKGARILVAPVGAVAAFEHGARKVAVGDASAPVGVFRAFSYAQTFNVFDLPAACVPAGRARVGGLPLGVQIVGRPFAEDEVLAAARIVEEALGRHLMHT